MHSFLINAYYAIKPIIPRRLQLALRRAIAERKREKYRHVWPIDEKTGATPPNWPGWPDGKKFAFVLTHDVEKERGLEKCLQLMEVEKRHGFRSLFNFVPTEYAVPQELRKKLENEGFEIGVHGLTHKGNIFKNRQQFESHAIKINHYLNDWRAVGFRSPSMFHHLEWMHDLHIEYDLSTFDTDPFEPQSDGLGTIFPLLVRTNSGRPGYIELPYSLPQDHTLFVILREKSAEIWKKKLDWIADHGGMALANVHPDYINFNGTQLSFEEYPLNYYENFLKYVKSRHEGKYWQALPKQVSAYVRNKLS